MSKLNIGVGDDFPLNDVAETGGNSCGHARDACASRREAWREARRERRRRWREFWFGKSEDKRPPAKSGDATYSDVPPSDKMDPKS